MGQEDGSFITIGRITRAQGLKGAVRIERLLEDEQLFGTGRRVIVAAAASPWETVIEWFRQQHGRSIIKLRGIDHISDAERWIGCEIKVPASELAPPNGWFYTFQLRGCRVFTEGGEYIGDTAGVLDSGGAQVLQVACGDEETLIPFAESYIKTIDVAQRRIEVDLPEDLRKLNK